MCHARDAILVCLDHRIPVLWKRDVSTLGLYADVIETIRKSVRQDNLCPYFAIKNLIHTYIPSKGHKVAKIQERYR